jgi:hypothetical protein
MMALLLSSNCIAKGARQFSFGKPYALDMTPPEGSELFQRGWRDGCESGVSSIASQFNKLNFAFRYDANSRQNKAYERAWQAANIYCTLSVYTSDMHQEGNFGQIW